MLNAKFDDPDVMNMAARAFISLCEDDSENLHRLMQAGACDLLVHGLNEYTNMMRDTSKDSSDLVCVILQAIAGIYEGHDKKDLVVFSHLRNELDLCTVLISKVAARHLSKRGEQSRVVISGKTVFSECAALFDLLLIMCQKDEASCKKLCDLNVWEFTLAISKRCGARECIDTHVEEGETRLFGSCAKLAGELCWLGDRTRDADRFQAMMHTGVTCRFEVAEFFFDSLLLNLERLRADQVGLRAMCESIIEMLDVWLSSAWASDLATKALRLLFKAYVDAGDGHGRLVDEVSTILEREPASYLKLERAMKPNQASSLVKVVGEDEAEQI